MHGFRHMYRRRLQFFCNARQERGSVGGQHKEHHARTSATVAPDCKLPRYLLCAIQALYLYVYMVSICRTRTNSTCSNAMSVTKGRVRGTKK